MDRKNIILKYLTFHLTCGGRRIHYFQINFKLNSIKACLQEITAQFDKSIALIDISKYSCVDTAAKHLTLCRYR